MSVLYIVHLSSLMKMTEISDRMLLKQSNFLIFLIGISALFSGNFLAGIRSIFFISLDLTFTSKTSFLLYLDLCHLPLHGNFYELNLGMFNVSAIHGDAKVHHC